MTPSITIYTKDNCPFCNSAKTLLRSKSLEFKEVDCNDPAELEALRVWYPEIRQMPAIFVNEQFVGGFAGLSTALVQLGL